MHTPHSNTPAHKPCTMQRTTKGRSAWTKRKRLDKTVPDAHRAQCLLCICVSCLLSLTRLHSRLHIVSAGSDRFYLYRSLTLRGNHPHTRLAQSHHVYARRSTRLYLVDRSPPITHHPARPTQPARSSRPSYLSRAPAISSRSHRISSDSRSYFEIARINHHKTHPLAVHPPPCRPTLIRIRLTPKKSILKRSKNARYHRPMLRSIISFRT